MESIEDMKGDSITSWIIRTIHCYSSMNFKKFTELGIHPGQLPVLKILSEREGLSLRELAQAVHIKPPTVTVTVQRLEKAELVVKKADLDDQRVSRIHLTEKGKNIQREIQHLFDENERILTQGFSEEELQVMTGFFRRMTDNMRQER